MPENALRNLDWQNFIRPRKMELQILVKGSQLQAKKKIFLASGTTKLKKLYFDFFEFSLQNQKCWSDARSALDHP